MNTINKKNYYIDLRKKEPFSKDEESFFDEQLKFWSVYKGGDGYYYCDRDNPKGGLFHFLGHIEDEMPSMLKKFSKADVHYGEFCDDLILAWKKDNLI
ncbi:MAG: hypothetical protein LBF00_03000 [Mycoplasmataceae bacterium]|nr:hypothetical protein [Mycoplasmataceae bacterium]